MSGRTAAEWREQRRCCDQHGWIREIVGEIAPPGYLGPDVWADCGDFPDHKHDEGCLGVVVVAVQSMQVRLGGAKSLLVRAEWDAGARVWKRATWSDSSVAPSAAETSRANHIADHVLFGKPYRGKGGRPRRRGLPGGPAVDRFSLIEAVVGLARENGIAPTQRQVSERVGYVVLGSHGGYEDGRRTLLRAIEGVFSGRVDWPRLLELSANAYRAAGALEAAGGDARPFEHPRDQWRRFFWDEAFGGAPTRAQLERLLPFDERTLMILLEAYVAKQR